MTTVSPSVSRPTGSIKSVTGTMMPILDHEFEQLHSTMRDPVHYRKSGLSLNHIVGCPLECAYCIRHSVGAYDIKTPRQLMSDDEAVKALTENAYFRPHITPVQLFNKATDPFLPIVKPHTFAVLDRLDERGYTNHVLVITRYQITEDDCKRLNSYRNLTLTILVTYSGIDNRMIEPIKDKIPKESLRTAYKNAERYRVILYWRPLVPELNDSQEHVARAVAMSRDAHATVFTGLFYRDEMKQYFIDVGLPDLYDGTARRKILPHHLEQRVLERWKVAGGGPALFRKTSCGVAYAHGMPDYNGHYGIPELCDICPKGQLDICARHHQRPDPQRVTTLLSEIDKDGVAFSIDDGAVQTVGLDEPPRYFLQHQMGYQVHDKRHPHFPHRHGRADIGWTDDDVAGVAE